MLKTFKKLFTPQYVKTATATALRPVKAAHRAETARQTKIQEKMSNQMKRKGIKKGFQFTLMVVGCAGLGKSTFINTLCEQEVIPKRLVSSPESSSLEKTVQISPYVVELDEDGTKISLTIVDTPGFGDNINKERGFKELLTFIENQYDEVLLEETRIKRNPKFQDNRVDCILYFITPSGHSLKEVDIEFMSKIGTRANIIPIIAKSDTLTPDELRAFRARIREDMAYHKLPVYDFPTDEEEEEEIAAENRELAGLMPFSIIGADGTFPVGGRPTRGRQYPWGICEVDNPLHCDFSRLRYVLLNSHLQDLKDTTHDQLYEKYRTIKLSIEEQKLKEAHSRDLSGSTELTQEMAKQVLLKEELLKKEEMKLREMEVRVQLEMEARRRELLLKEQSLKEMEMRLSSQADLSRN